MKKVFLLLSVFITFCLYLNAQDSLQQFVGKYKFPQGSVVLEVDVVVTNSILQVNSILGNASLEKTGTDQFSMPSYNGTVIFIRNEAKKITGINIEVMNISLEGTREEKENNLINLPLPIYKSTFPIKYLPAMLLPEDKDLPISNLNLF